MVDQTNGVQKRDDSDTNKHPAAGYVVVKVRDVEIREQSETHEHDKDKHQVHVFFDDAYDSSEGYHNDNDMGQNEDDFEFLEGPFMFIFMS